MRNKRARIFKRDGWTCQLGGCDLRTFPPRERTLDHIIPVSKGGTLRDENLRAACGPCNRLRGNEEPPKRNPPTHYSTRGARVRAKKARRRERLIAAGRDPDAERNAKAPTKFRLRESARIVARSGAQP